GLSAGAGELGDVHRAGEADDAIVAGVDAQHGTGVRAEGASVVGQVGAVGGAHLADPCTGGGDQIGQAEAGTDLDQLSAADDDLPAAAQGGGRQEQGGGAVVDDQGVLRLWAGREQGGPGAGPTAGPGSRPQVELDVGVPAGLQHRLPRG